MSNKNYDSYVKEVNSKINSLETTVTEAHALANDAHKNEIEQIMTDLQSIKNTLDEIK